MLPFFSPANTRCSCFLLGSRPSCQNSDWPPLSPRLSVNARPGKTPVQSPSCFQSISVNSFTLCARDAELAVWDPHCSCKAPAETLWQGESRRVWTANYCAWSQHALGLFCRNLFSLLFPEWNLWVAPFWQAPLFLSFLARRSLNAVTFSPSLQSQWGQCGKTPSSSSTRWRVSALMRGDRNGTWPPLWLVVSSSATLMKVRAGVQVRGSRLLLTPAPISQGIMAPEGGVWGRGERLAR